MKKALARCRTRSAGTASPFARARMIHPAADAGVGSPAPFVRQIFAVAAIEGEEKLTVTALGLYRCFINGVRVGADLLTPGWTCYDKRLSFQTYDVASLLNAGDNVIDIWLADGWYRSQLMWGADPIFNCWGDKLAALAEISNRSGVVVATDSFWQSGLTPIRKSGIYLGEVYDAREEGAPADKGCSVIAFDPTVLVAHESNAVRELVPLAEVRSWRDAEGRTIYDFGQNAAGYASLVATGEPGARLTIDHAEILDGDGGIDNANMRTAAARIEYVLKGGGDEAYRPHFTFQGFRYARVAIAGDARIVSIASVPISSAIRPRGAFVSGNALVNRLVENTAWSLRSNFIEVPTDCPQRDERLGWTGDAQVFAPTACYLNDSHAFLRKWLRDVIADQRADGAISYVSPDPTRMQPQGFPGFFGSAGWGDAICVIPWVLWTHYGDRVVLKETLPAMVRWVDFLWSISDGPIVSTPRTIGARGFTFGDWLQPSGTSEKPLPTTGDDFVATVYLFISASLAARAAEVLGDKRVAARMRQRAGTVRTAFQREFIASSGRLVYDDQTSYALSILHDLIPATLLPAAARYFKEAVARTGNRIGTGFLGTPALLPALVKIGEPALAATVFLQEGAPGWLYQVKSGATTIWERWDALLPNGRAFSSGMNSFNHYAYGAVCEWLFQSVAGFRPDADEPAFRHVFFEPTIIAELGSVSAHHDSIVGRVEAAWRVKGANVIYDVTLPADSRGTLILSPSYADVAVDGKRRRRADRLPLGGGRHRITFRLSQTAAASRAERQRLTNVSSTWRSEGRDG